jgi:hypothetical protein
MPDATARTVYVQQQQVPGGWEDHASTEDRALAMARYKAFAREKGTRLIERTERVLIEGSAKKELGARACAAAILRAIEVDISDGERRTRRARAEMAPHRPPPPPTRRANPAAARVSVPPIARRQDIRPSASAGRGPKPH